MGVALILLLGADVAGPVARPPGSAAPSVLAEADHSGGLAPGRADASPMVEREPGWTGVSSGRLLPFEVDERLGLAFERSTLLLAFERGTSFRIVSSLLDRL